MMISCCIPAKDEKDPLLADLIASIKAQDYPQDQIEIIVVTEGDSEQAKAIGIKRAKGEIICMLCADNYFPDPKLFTVASHLFETNPQATGIFSKRYSYPEHDNSLNRYFALIGNNDPVCFYLDKCDRKPYYEIDEAEIYSMVKFEQKVPSLGCNGFFYRREHLIQADLDHYYPMDCAEDLRRKGLNLYLRLNYCGTWHRTADNFITFFKKRYKYARDLYCDRQDRRWKMLSEKRDYWRLAGFILCTISIIPCVLTSIKGFSKVRDWAWFWHWPVCFGTLITYGILICRNLLKYRSLSQLFSVQTVSKPV